MNQYTDRKVHRPLAEKFGNGQPRSGHLVRFSVVGDAGGIAAQRAAHFSIYGQDPAIAEISNFPDEAWDPAHPEVGASYGISWIRMADLHHSARGNRPVAAIVAVGDVVLLNITLSTTLQHIQREDGENENGVTRLVLALVNHFPSLRELCWADDVTRAGRDKADWTQITTKCKHRDIVMVFGGQRYDQRNPGDELALGALGLVGGNDDPNRRRKLTGKRLMKYKLGGAAISELQMPHGWHHKKDKHGRPTNEGDRGLIPEADAGMIPVLQTLYTAHASGETYQQIAHRMIALESKGLLRRRDHTNLDNTYAAAVDDLQARYDIAKSFFVRTSFRPRVPPSEEQIARYLAGEDAADVFDADTRLFIAKVELMRTGRYFRRLKNDIRGRNIVLDGIPATYENDLDEYGWFDVLAAPWAWPTNEAGQDVPAFGIPDQTCRMVAARLLRELRAPRTLTGGRAHRTTHRRVIQGISNWVVDPDHIAARYDDVPTEWGVEARANVSGRANFILLFRREPAASARRLGWSNLGPGEKKPDHIAATGSLDELAASVAVHLDRQVRTLVAPDTVATVSEVRTTEPDIDPTARWEVRLQELQAGIGRLEAEARGHRTMAAMMASGGDEQEAKQYASQASAAIAQTKTLADGMAALQAKLRQHRDEQRGNLAREDSGDISVAAYLVAGLEHASRNNGDAPTRLGQLSDELLVEWRFLAEDDDLKWSCVALIPLASGGQARLPLNGTIRNVRTRNGRALATTETVVRYLFEEGRELTDVANLLQVTRKTLLVKRVMPWLVGNRVTARGAKCALVDHPLPAVRREMYRRIQTGPTPEPTKQTNAYLDRLRSTYLDPELAWGDAAVPDDTTWVAQALTLLTQDTGTRKHGLPVLDVALALGRSEADVRELVKPQKRSGGFTRPRYLAYANKAKTHVKAIGCPHGRCKGRRFANHVVLLPEVAASGYGVICSHCRRTPSEEGTWPFTQFPAEYLLRWTNRGPGGSLRQESQTVIAP